MALSKKYAYYIDREKLGVVEYGGTSNDSDGITNWQSISVSGKTIRIFCTKLADHMTSANMDTVSSTIEHGQVPAQFHEGLVHKAISIGYKDPRNINMELAQFFDAEFEKGIKRGKISARSNLAKTSTVKQVDF